MKHLISLAFLCFSCLASQEDVKIIHDPSDTLTTDLETTLFKNIAALPAEIKVVLAQHFLEASGYTNVESLEGVGLNAYVRTYLLSKLDEEETAFFGEGREEGNYRPTRFAKNPFLRSANNEFGYVHQELYQRGKGHFVCDEVNGKQMLFRPLSHQRIYFVGPTIQGNFAMIGDHFKVNICTPRATTTLRVKDPKDRFLHTRKNGEGAISGNNGYSFFDKPDWQDFEDDQPTALTMDEETGYFYGGTESGKLHCYYWFTDVIDRNTVKWRGSTFPISLDKRIDDIELSLDARFLWVLADNMLYSYFIRENELKLQLAIPYIPSEDLIKEEKERMVILRRTPHVARFLLGGTLGTVLIVDTEKQACFSLTKFQEAEPIADVWWQGTQVVLLNRAGKLRRGEVSLEDAEHIFCCSVTLSENYN